MSAGRLVVAMAAMRLYDPRFEPELKSERLNASNKSLKRKFRQEESQKDFFFYKIQAKLFPSWFRQT